MSNGVLCFAHNNGKVNYLQQAEELAKRVKQHLNLPTTLVTSTSSELQNPTLFDKVIEIADNNENVKRYYNGTLSHQRLSFKNNDRVKSYELSPYDTTLVLDTDYIICNDVFNNAFNSVHDFQIYRDGVDLCNWRKYAEFEYINDTGIPFYWATCFCFKKTTETKIFFDLLQHLVKNWKHYEQVYNLGSRNFRNDHVFSIAIHMMNGFEDNDWAKILPGKMFYTLDRDIITKIKNNTLTFLLQKEKYNGEYVLASTKDINVHVMNKFSLGELINE
jgi:hypothetical protein|tara:strand:- start:72 stop:896 length:825 start_codon:yes stop_codon:yes gene_type:complete